MLQRPLLIPLACALLVGGCENEEREHNENGDWPPFEDSLLAYFDEHRSSLEELEREMTADGHERMNSRILSGALSHPGAPELAAEQVRKYERLIEHDGRELSVLRRRGATEFEFLNEPVDTSLYLFRFVHDIAGEHPAECDASMRRDPCGQCAIDLGDDWRLEYDWFPQSLDEEARKCR